MTDETQNNSVFSVVQLQDKRIEPDKDSTRGSINRNNALGNTTRRDFEIYRAQAKTGRLMSTMPLNRGGWFSAQFGSLVFDDIEFDQIISRSVDGFNQKIMVSSSQTQTIDDKREKGFLASVLGRKNTNG